MKESKYNKFIRVAEARTNKIIDMIRLLGNCSNTAVYEYTDGDIKKIFEEKEDNDFSDFNDQINTHYSHRNEYYK